jgi:hypothetical protein
MDGEVGGYRVRKPTARNAEDKILKIKQLNGNHASTNQQGKKT